VEINSNPNLPTYQLTNVADVPMTALTKYVLTDYDAVRQCLRTATTNRPIVHPPGDMLGRTAMVMMMSRIYTLPPKHKIRHCEAENTCIQCRVGKICQVANSRPKDNMTDPQINYNFT
jgi:hypothetical protein